MAEMEEAELLVLGDLNVNLQGITNLRMELLQGNFNGQDEHRAATIGALSSLGLKDTQQQFQQRDPIGLLPSDDSITQEHMRYVLFCKKSMYPNSQHPSTIHNIHQPYSQEKDCTVHKVHAT